MSRHVVDLVGKKFNRLTVIRMVSKFREKVKWECLCECGNTHLVDSGNLKRGRVKSCGCLTKENRGFPKNLVGQRFSRILVLEFHHIDKKGRYNWSCLCDCGHSLVVRSDSLISGNTQSCGCYHSERAKESKNLGKSNGNWRGGMSINYPPKWNESLREAVRQRDHRTCQFPNCRYSDVDNKERLSVHHIDGNKKYCSSVNLISLCRHHHGVVENNNPRGWNNYFYSITQKYEAHT